MVVVVLITLRSSECSSPRNGGGVTRQGGIVLPFESTLLPLVEAMLTLAEVNSSTVLVDLGCGDGRIARTAVRRGARRAIGVDIDDELIRRARALTFDNESQQLEFVTGDMTSHDMLSSGFLASATVVTLYWTPEFLKQHAQSVIDHLQEGTVIITHDYVIPEHTHVAEWLSELHHEKRSINGDHVAYLYKYLVGPRDPKRNFHRQTVRPQCSSSPRDSRLEIRLIGGFPVDLRSHTIVYSSDCTLFFSQVDQSQPTRETAADNVTLPVHIVVVDGRVKALWLQGAEQRNLAIAYRTTATEGRASASSARRVLLGAGSTRNPATGKTSENMGLQERAVPLTVTVELRLQPPKRFAARPPQKSESKGTKKDVPRDEL